MNQITGLPENCCDSEDNNDLEDNLEYPHNAFLGTSYVVNNTNNNVSLMTLPNTAGSFLVKKSPPIGLNLRYKGILDYSSLQTVSFRVIFDIFIPDTGISHNLVSITLNPKNTGGVRVPIEAELNILVVSADSIKYNYIVSSDGVYYKALTSTFTSVGLFSQYNFRPEIVANLTTVPMGNDYHILWSTLVV